MTTVYCDMDCEFNDKDECICTCDEIDVQQCKCSHYEKVYTDKFYAFCEDKEKNELYWKQELGLKEELWGREVFLQGNSYTDGKTGMFVMFKDKVKYFLKDKDKILEGLEFAEKTHGLSPLYTSDYKFSIRSEHNDENER